VDVHMKHLLKEQMQEDYNILNSLKKLNLSSWEQNTYELPKRKILHIEQRESLKSRKLNKLDLVTLLLTTCT